MEIIEDLPVNMVELKLEDFPIEEKPSYFDKDSGYFVEDSNNFSRLVGFLRSKKTDSPDAFSVYNWI